GAALHRPLSSLLDRASERDAPLELLGDRASDQLRVELRLADLRDVEADLLTGALLEQLAQLLDLGPGLADHDARLGGVDRDGDLVCRALDVDARHAGIVAPLA